MKTNKMKSLQLLIRAFEEDVLFNPEREHLKIQSVFIDHKDSERRAVIMVAEDGDMDAALAVAKKHFGKTLHKVIKRPGSPEFTVSLKTGGGIRHNSTPGWGTLGGVFSRKNDNSNYGLSNTHVIANANNTQEGDNCIYDPNIIAGKLFKWYRLKPPPAINKMDAAIFRIGSGHDVEWVPNKPKRWIGPRINLRVYKNGKATGITHGHIMSYNGAAKVRLNGRAYYFSGIMAIKSVGGHFNMPGDSGSIVLSEQGHHMVGLVFAKYHEFCWALPISRIGPLLRND